MKIVISLLNFQLGQLGGGETYLRGLIAQLPDVCPHDEIVLLAHRENAEGIVVPGIAREVVDYSGKDIMRLRALEALTAFRALKIERVLRDLKPDVIFFPQQAIFPKHVHSPTVLVVHDLNHLFFPKHLSFIQRACRRRACNHAIAQADRIISDSDFTKQTILDKCGTDAAKIETIPLGFDPVDCADLEPYAGITEPYLYYPGTTHIHKNHATLFETIAELRRRGKFPYRMILSGFQTPHWKNLQAEITRLGLEEMVTHLGYIPFEEVWRLYRGAAAVLFPTTFEGFGLPVLEATAVKNRVIVSRLPIFQELGVPEQFRIDFANPDELLQALAQPGPTILEKRPSTWRECAVATAQVLRNARAA